MSTVEEIRAAIEKLDRQERSSLIDELLESESPFAEDQNAFPEDPAVIKELERRRENFYAIPNPESHGRRLRKSFVEAMVKIVFLPEARRELRVALAWYFEWKPGLDIQFLNCLDDLLLILSEHPKQFSTKVGRYRRALMRRFPYAIYYEPTHRFRLLCLSLFPQSARP